MASKRISSLMIGTTCSCSYHRARDTVLHKYTWAILKTSSHRDTTEKEMRYTKKNKTKRQQEKTISRKQLRSHHLRPCIESRTSPAPPSHLEVTCSCSWISLCLPSCVQLVSEWHEAPHLCASVLLSLSTACPHSSPTDSAPATGMQDGMTRRVSRMIQQSFYFQLWTTV